MAAGALGAAPQGVVVNKPIAVPPVYEEVQPPAPATANMLWQPGHWAWRGTWVWVPGEYIQSTSPRATWVMGQWVAGSDGNWLWSPALGRFVTCLGWAGEAPAEPPSRTVAAAERDVKPENPGPELCRRFIGRIFRPQIHSFHLDQRNPETDRQRREYLVKHARERELQSR